MAGLKGRHKNAENDAAVSTEHGWPDWADAKASQRLRAGIRGGEIGHAYLLSGPKGVGKTALARAFAQTLCCTNIEPTDRSQPCGRCRGCRNVLRGTHPDVETFSLETQAMVSDKPARGSTLNIETIRRLRSSTALLPLEIGRRILIVDDAETMLEPAQQALLKTLEEPPRVVTVLLLTDEPEALLETVRSRCQPIVVSPVVPAAVQRTLEQRGIDEELAAEIAALSRGCPAWALAASSDKKFLQTRRSERDSAAAWIASSQYDQLVTAFKLGEQFNKRRSDVVGVVQAAIQLLRDEMIGAASGGNPVLTDGPLPAGATASALSMSKAVSASLQCLSDLESNVRPRLALEAMVVAWPNSGPQRD